MKYRFQCAECGYAYKSFWYEPNWIAKRFYLADHKSFHHNSWLNDYPSQWKRHGAEMERERIIQLLYKWDSLIVFDVNDPEDDLKILREMRRAYEIGYEQGWNDNK